jgi:Rhodopirellula transposase DDE domain
MAVSAEVEAGLAAKFASMRRLGLSERQWREYLGIEARALGHGGIAAVARASGCSETTVAAGVTQTEGGGDERPAGRSRRPGGGRKKAEDAQPGLREAVLGAAEEGTRGDPMVAVTWCSLSLREIARRMIAQGFRCGKDAVTRILREDGYSLQGMAKVLEGRQHPDRDAQFRGINAAIGEYLAAGDPVVSADGKKKEQLGPFYRAGAAWQRKGSPVEVRDHDFPDEELGRIAPYGVYDIAANRGFVSVGTGHDTAAFAVNALRLWWRHEGQFRYPGADKLLVTCDAGGSNGYRCRLWKQELEALARETGLEITVMHFPPGTSKWNKIEHRLFCHITRTWRGRPLMTAEDAVAGIAATVTSQGLKCTAVVDPDDYPVGTEISDERMRSLEFRSLDRADLHGEWNYTILPAPRQGPEPEPGPGRRPGHAGPDDAVLAALAALAGVPAPRDLHAAVAVDWYADRERHKATGRGGARRRAPNRTETYLKLSDEAVLIAGACRIRLGMTWVLLGRLFGVHQSTICVFANNAVPILEKHGITPDGRPRVRTMDQLREHAQAARTGTEVFGNLPEQEKYPKRGTRQTRHAQS